MVGRLIFGLCIVSIVMIITVVVLCIEFNKKREEMERTIISQDKMLHNYWFIIEELVDELDIDMAKIKEDYSEYLEK